MATISGVRPAANGLPNGPSLLDKFVPFALPCAACASFRKRYLERWLLGRTAIGGRDRMGVGYRSPAGRSTNGLPGGSLAPPEPGSLQDPSDLLPTVVGSVTTVG